MRVVSSLGALNSIIRTLSRIIRTLSRIIRTLDRIIRTLDRIIRTLSRIIRTLSRIIRTLSRIIRALTDPHDPRGSAFDQVEQAGPAGATEREECRDCAAGSFTDDGRSTACTLCPAGSVRTAPLGGIPLTR